MTTGRSKWMFDVSVTLMMMPLWLPVCLLAALALWVTAGSPVTYSSQRRIFRSQTRKITKFRTMVRNADLILNRETVPITDTCFLNIPPEHPVYTPVGRALERYALTELPQLIHVLAGKMSLVGNRPLPENVIRALRQRYDYVEDRFLSTGGLTGPVQLVGRDGITDEERLAIEIDYCLLSMFNYRWRVDAMILWNTVLVALKLKPGFNVAEVREMLADCMSPSLWAARGSSEACRRQAALRFSIQRPRPFLIDGDEFLVTDFGYRGMRLIGTRPLQTREMLQFGTLADPTLSFSATICWTRERSDGRHEAGLSVAPGLGSAMRLGHLLRPISEDPMRAQRTVLAPSTN